MKYLKWLIILLLVLLGTLIGSIYFLFNPALQKLKPELIKTLANVVGAEVEIGEISAQLLPSPKVELSNLQVGGERGAKLGRLFISTNISELMAGKIIISDITVESPNLEILKLADGSFQIGKLKFGSAPGTSGAAADTQSAPKVSGDKDPEAKKIELKLSKLTVTNGQIAYADAVKDLKLQISDFGIELANFTPASLSPVKFSLSLMGKSPGNISGAGKFIADSFKTKFPIGDLTLQISSLDLSQVSQILSKINPDLKNLASTGTIEGTLSGEGKGDSLKTNVDLDLTSADIRYTNPAGKVVINKAALTPLKLSLNGELVPGDKFNVNAFDVKFQDSIVSGNTSLDLNDKVNAVKLVNLTLQKLFVADIAKFAALPVPIDGAVGGNLRIDLSKKPIPDMDGTIELTNVNLPESGAENISGKLLFQKNSIGTEGIQLKFKGEDIKLAGQLLQHAGNQLNTPNLNVTALGGSLQIQNSYLNEGDKPFSTQISGGGIDLRRLLALSKSVPPYSVLGNLSRLNATLKGSANNPKQTLSSQFGITVVKGEIVGVNLIGGVFQKLAIPGLGAALAQFVPEKYRQLVSAANSTEFDSFTLDGALFNGSEVNLTKAELTHAAYKILGSGKAGTDGTLDLKTQMKLTPEITTGMVASNAKLKLLLDGEDNLTFPLMITKGNGPIIILPDVTELGKNAARGVAKDAAAKALDKVAPGLGTGASKLLNKLF